MAQVNPLRPITQRLNSTPVEDLPRYAGFLASSILSYSDHLRHPEASKNDGSIQVHKLITRVSSLLQDRSQEARFTGVVLVKALIETVEPSVLATSGTTWVRSLISCLNKQDPPLVKRLAIITVTRLFLLTKDDQAMVREITTPSLPAFMTASLNAIKPATVSVDGEERQVLSTLLQPVLQCWTQLLKSFPSTVRPFVSAIRTIILSLISSQITPQDVKQVASQVFANLHFCALKDTASSEWTQTTTQIVEAIHQNADLIFRSVIEEWSPVNMRQPVALAGKRAKNEVHLGIVDAVGMDKWTGLRAGCLRIIDLLNLLSTFLVGQHASAVVINTAEIFDLTARLTAVLWPTKDYSLRENKEIARDEREELFINLPRVHAAVLELNERMVKSYGRIYLPTARQTLSQICDIVDSESSDSHIRTSVYTSISELLQRGAIQLTKKDSEHVTNLVRQCCRDLMSGDATHSKPTSKSKTDNDLLHASNKNQQAKEKAALVQLQNALSDAAWNLLPITLTHIPAQLFTSSIRAEVDRTAILIGHEEAMLASVMNPPVPRKGSQLTPSILPFLTAFHGGGLNIEALMRPRMPILRDAGRSVDAEEDEEQHDSPSQSDTNLEDANLSALNNHIDQQIENGTVANERIDIHQTKKRDFVEAEDTITTSSEESSKRPKTGPSPVQVEVLPDSSDSHMQEEMVPVEVAEAVSADGIQESPSPAPSAESTPLESWVAASPVPLPPRDIGQDDDSDDSEIPLIDTALSSDEDEDEDDD